MSNALRIIINGETRELTAPSSLAQLVSTLGLKPEQIAIELNQVVIRRASWESTMLKEDDRIEIVHFVGGG
jgi:thiamine biosynthesis protein ThiS